MHRKIFHSYSSIVLALILLPGAAQVEQKANTLIIPGKSIGSIQIGQESAKVENDLGEPDDSDAAMGGKGWEFWYLGDRRDKKSPMFHRAGEVAIFTQKDMEHDSAAHPSPALIRQINITSTRYATAEGIAPGSTLEQIRAKFPGLERDGDDEMISWPSHGPMQFFIEKKQGIAFAIRKSDGVCVQISVVRPGTDQTRHAQPIVNPESAKS